MVELTVADCQATESDGRITKDRVVMELRQGSGRRLWIVEGVPPGPRGRLPRIGDRFRIGCTLTWLTANHGRVIRGVDITWPEQE